MVNFRNYGMKPLSKSFECRTNLTMNECKELIEENFNKKTLISSSDIILEHVNENAIALEFKLMQSKIRGFFVEMDAKLYQYHSGAQIEGQVYMTARSFLLAVYFIVITFVLVFVFRPIPLLSIFFLLGCLMAISFLVITVQSRNNLLDTVCRLLNDHV